jgi:4-amino-4-deoxy-L-arabinose transferase-like glycosyltransferase
MAFGGKRTRPAWLLGCWCGVLFFWGLGAGELYQTEGLRARVASEALSGGRWLVPTLYGEPLLTKPPGMYAAIALASWPRGAVTAATARLPSALAATATVLLFYATFARRLGRRAGLTAAFLLPASFLWLERVPSAEIDMPQLAWVAGSLCCFLRALEAAEASPAGPRRGRAWVWWVAALGCVSGGALTKWTAPAFFYLTVLPLLWWRGRLRLLASPAHLAALALAAALGAAWVAVAVSAAGWPAFRDTVTREALQHLSPVHHGRPYPWAEVLTFPLLFLLAALPWSACTLPALRPGFAGLWGERGRRLLQLMHCWAWPNLLFWSLVPGHKLRHALPLHPGLAGLAAFVWLAWRAGRLRWPLPRLRAGVALAALLASWLAVKLLFVHAFVPARNPEARPRAKGEAVAARVPAGQTLYLFRLKDEGVLFYYGRPARRLPGPAALPRAGAPLYCLLAEAEWRGWSGPGRPEVLLRLCDEQGAPVWLVRVG